MNYTIALVNNHPKCMVRTLDNRIVILEDNETYQILKNIKHSNNYKEHRGNVNNLYLKHKDEDKTVLFKDYENLYPELCKLYNKYRKKELLLKKVAKYTTMTATGLMTTHIIAATLFTQSGLNLNKVLEKNKPQTRTEKLVEEEHGLKVGSVPVTLENNDEMLVNTSGKEYETDVQSEVRMSEPTPMEQENSIDLKEELTIEPNSSYASTPLEAIQIDVNANYSESINERTNPYKEEIEKYGKKRGISPELLYDIVSQEYGGSGNNLMHVVFDSWKDQIVESFNFETNRLEKIVLTDNPDRYTGKVDIIITRSDLKNYKSNLAVGTILLQYSLSQFDYNIPLGIQAYNNGVGAVNQIVKEASRKTGMSEQAILETNNPVWLDYTGVIEQGDKIYFENVVKHIDEDQIDSKTNDVYSVQYMEDGEIQTSEVQFKLK